MLIYFRLVNGLFYDVAKYFTTRFFTTCREMVLSGNSPFADNFSTSFSAILYQYYYQGQGPCFVLKKKSDLQEKKQTNKQTKTTTKNRRLKIRKQKTALKTKLTFHNEIHRSLLSGVFITPHRKSLTDQFIKNTVQISNFDSSEAYVLFWEI